MTDTKCPCGGRIVTDYAHGDTHCQRCGLVAQETIYDTGYESTAYDHSDLVAKSRSGGPIKHSKIALGLRTEIDRYDHDIKGHSIAPERKAQLYRMRKQQKRAHSASSYERNLSNALPMLDKVCSQLHISSQTKEQTAKLYRQAAAKSLVSGRSIESMVAATLYYTSKKNRAPLTFKELSQQLGITPKQIYRAYKALIKKLKLPTHNLTPADYITRLASTLKLSGEQEEAATKILQQSINAGTTSGKHPIGAAAAAIYLTNKNSTPTKIQEASKSSRSALFNLSKEMNQTITYPQIIQR